jgi:flagellar biosynthesis protein FliR
MRLTDAQLLSWLQEYLWVFTRIGAALMVAPVFGSGQTPLRVRLMLALVLTLLLTPLLAPAAPLPLWSADWFLQIGQQVLIGIAMGLVLRLCFEAVMLAGSLIANSMGLGFAQLADPVNGTSAPVVGVFMTVFATLLFLALGGHILLIELLATSLRTLPPGGAGLGAADLHALALAGAQIFSGALRVALPAVIALLLANLAFGVISRAAPSLNLISVGMPVSLLVGLLMLYASLPSLQAVFTDLLPWAGTFIEELVDG